jgi:hypothetical protein
MNREFKKKAETFRSTSLQVNPFCHSSIEINEFGAKMNENKGRFVAATELRRKTWKSWRKPGTDVMISNLCDFSAKKLAFFSKTNVMITFFCKN